MSWRPESIKVFEVLPPLVDTPMTHGLHVPKIDPETVANAIIRGLSSDRYEVLVGEVRGLAVVAKLAPRGRFEYALSDKGRDLAAARLLLSAFTSCFERRRENASVLSQRSPRGRRWRVALWFLFSLALALYFSVSSSAAFGPLLSVVALLVWSALSSLAVHLGLAVTVELAIGESRSKTPIRLPERERRAERACSSPYLPQADPKPCTLFRLEHSGHAVLVKGSPLQRF
jgi:hypothetical protein